MHNINIRPIENSFETVLTANSSFIHQILVHVAAVGLDVDITVCMKMDKRGQERAYGYTITYAHYQEFMHFCEMTDSLGCAYNYGIKAHGYKGIKLD